MPSDHGRDGDGRDGAREDDERTSRPDEPPEGGGWYGEPPGGWTEDDDGSVFGPTPGEGDDVEPGEPRLVNALFVVLGALTALAVLADLVGLV